MEDSEGTSCQLCLRADDPADMIPVNLAHALTPSATPTLLCRECIAAVLAGSRKVIDEETAPESDADAE